MFCPYCGAASDGGKFCASCGSPLPIMPESAVKQAEEAPLPWEAPQVSPEAAPETENAAPVWQAPYGQPEYVPETYAESQKAPEEPKKKKKALPWILAGAGVLLLAGLAVLFIFLFIKKDPTAKVAAASAKSMAALKKTEAGSVANELEKSEVKVSVDLSEVLPYYYNFDGTVHVTLSDDLDAGKLALLLSLDVKGKELADLGLYMDEKALAVASDTLLGNDVYGLSFDTLQDDLKKSIFAPDSGSDYELPESIYNILKEIDKSPLALYKEARGSLEELLADGGTKLLASIKKHAEITEDEGRFSVGTSKVECKVIKADADEEATRAILEDMAAWLKEDATKEKLKRFFDIAAKISNLNGRSYAYGSSPKEADAESMMEDFYDSLDDALDETEDTEMLIAFYIHKQNGQLIGFRMDYENDSEEGFLEMAAGPDFENPEEIRFIQQSNDYKTSLTVEVTENTDSVYEAEVTVTDGRREQNYEFEWKKKRGGFTISQDGRELAAGTLEIDGDKILLEVDNTGVTVEINKGAKTPDVPKYKNIVQIKEEDFEDLYEDIYNEIRKIMSKLY